MPAVILPSVFRVYRAAVVSAVNALTYSDGSKVFRQVIPVGGQFGPKEVDRIASNAPAAFVAVMAAEQEQPVQQFMQLTTVVVASAKDAKQLSRHDGVLDASESIVRMLTEFSPETFGLCAHRPTEVRASTLYNEKLDDKGISLWLVTWTQCVNMVQEDAAGFADLLRMHADWFYAGDLERAAYNDLALEGSILVPDNAIIVEDASDFPAPVGGFIQLEDNAWYHVPGEVTIPAPLLAGNGTVITGVHAEVSKIKCASLNPVLGITSVKRYLRMGWIQLVQQGAGKVLSMEGVGYVNWMHLDNVSLLHEAGGALGRLAAGFAIFKNSTFYNFTEGWDCVGGPMFFVQEEVLYQQGDGGLDNAMFKLGAATFNTFRVRQSTLINEGNGVMLSGLAASANIVAGGIGEFTAVRRVSTNPTPPDALVGVTSWDVRWSVSRSQGIPNSSTATLVMMNNNTVPTTFGAANTPTVPGGVSVLDSNSRFSKPAEHSVRYEGERTGPANVAMTVLLTRVAGDHTYTLRLRKNGVDIRTTTRTLDTSTREALIHHQYQEVYLENGDTYAVLVECGTGTQSVIATQIELEVSADI